MGRVRYPVTHTGKDSEGNHERRSLNPES